MSVRTTVKSIQDIMRQDTGVDGDAQRISQLCWMFFLKIIDDQDQELELLNAEYRSPIPPPLQWRTWAADPEGITGDALLAFVNNELFLQLKTLQIAGAGDRRRVVRDVFEDAYNYMKSGQLMRQVVNKISAVDFNSLADRQHFGEIYEQILNDLQSAGNAGEYYTPRAVTAFMAERIDPRPGEELLDPACGTGGFLTCALRHMRKHYVKTVEDEEQMQQGLRAIEKKQLPHMLCVTNMLLHGIHDPAFVRHDNALARSYVSYTAADHVDIVLTNPPFGGREEDGIESNFPKRFQTRETADLFLALIIRLLRRGGRAAVVLPDGTLFGEGVKTRLKEHLLEECNLHTIVRLPNSVFKPYASIGTNLLFFEKGEPTREIWFYEHRVPEGQKAYSMTKPIKVEHLQPCVDWWGGRERKDRVETEVAWRVTADDVKTRGYNLDIKNPHLVPEDHGDPEQLLKALDDAELETARSAQGNPGRGAPAMNAERLLAHFERVADAPNAVDRLRRFVLDLAVRGKLVPQDPREGAVSESIRSLLPQLNQVCIDGPFELPSNWVWARVEGLAQMRLGKMLDKAKNRGRPRRYLRNANVRWFDFDLSGLLEMPFEDSEVDEFELRTADVLVCEGGEPGRAAVWDGRMTDLYFQKAIHRLRFCELVDAHYFVRALRASADDGRLAGFFTGTGIKHLTGKGLGSYLFPLPPVGEQRRIVRRIDELMASCDQLEAARAEREAKRERLTRASFTRLNTTDPAPVRFADDARFALDTLPTLTALRDQVQQLRQTILNLAVRGKLLSQNATDESALDLLERIRGLRSKLTNQSGHGQKSVTLEAPFEPPTGWTWTTLGELCSKTGSGSTPRGGKQVYQQNGIPFLRSQNVHNDGLRLEGVAYIDDRTHAAMEGTRVFPGDVLLNITGGSIGRCCIVPSSLQEANVSQHVAIIRLLLGDLSPFLHIVILSPYFQSFVIGEQTGAGRGGLPKKRMDRIPVPLPPLREQRRIVERVSELMKLCERLEASLSNAETTRSRLLDVLLADALAPIARELHVTH